MVSGKNNGQMDGTARKSVVVSAVNIRKGGTLTVLRDCLSFLASRKDLKVTAIVHSADLCRYEGIEYIEFPWSIRSWAHRLWCEYIVLGRLSRKREEQDLWLTLHDTTPRVRAKKQAVYCHTSFPFLKIKASDWRFNPKIPLFALLTKYAYRANVRRNDFLIVQQDWFRAGLSALTDFPASKIIVAPPAFEGVQPCHSERQRRNLSYRGTEGAESISSPDIPTFIYPSTPDCHKNFETLCKASALLERRLGEGRFRTVITVRGDENRYARFLKKRWGNVSSLEFAGLLPKDKLFERFGQASALVFSSRTETWGLPISEFIPTGKPLILADLPYAHEAASGAARAAFFTGEDASALATLMEGLIKGEGLFAPVPAVTHKDPYARDWESLFSILLDENTPAR